MWFMRVIASRVVVRRAVVSGVVALGMVWAVAGCTGVAGGVETERDGGTAARDGGRSTGDGGATPEDGATERDSAAPFDAGSIPETDAGPGVCGAARPDTSSPPTSASWRYGGGAGYPDRVRPDGPCTTTVVRTRTELEAALADAEPDEVVYVAEMSPTTCGSISRARRCASRPG
jgi:hypothetical protein